MNLFRELLRLEYEDTTILRNVGTQFQEVTSFKTRTLKYTALKNWHIICYYYYYYYYYY